MADATLKQKIRDVLKTAYFKDANDLVDVSDGSGDSIDVVIVSRKLDGKRIKVRDDLLTSIFLDGLLPAELSKISLVVGTSPEEIKAT